MRTPFEVEKKIAELLDDFYKRRIAKITDLKLRNTLARKNPYLYRAIGIQKAADVVEEILRAYMSSSDEGIFGNAFFEPLAKYVSEGIVAPSEGVDVVIDKGNIYTAIAVKSGINVFNAQSRRRQVQDFAALGKRLYKLEKHLDPVIGYSYGRKEQKANGSSSFRELAGQPLWEELTGDPDFYLEIIRLMKEKPQEHQQEYQVAWTNALNLFTGEFIQDFCKPNGEIDWEMLVRFNSGKTVKTLIVRPKSMRLKPGGSQQLAVNAVYADGSTEDISQAVDTKFDTENTAIVNATNSGLVSVLPSAAKGEHATLTITYTHKTTTARVIVSQ